MPGVYFEERTHVISRGKVVPSRSLNTRVPQQFSFFSLAVYSSSLAVCVKAKKSKGLNNHMMKSMMTGKSHCYKLKCSTGGPRSQSQQSTHSLHSQAHYGRHATFTWESFQNFHNQTFLKTCFPIESLSIKTVINQNKSMYFCFLAKKHVLVSLFPTTSATAVHCTTLV